MTLSFNIHYKGKFYPKAVELRDYTGAVPQQDTLVIFNGPELETLKRSRLPGGSWRVKQIAHDIDEGKDTVVTVTLELRSDKRKRDTQSDTAERPNKDRAKDPWDKIAAVTPLVLGLIVTGGAALFGYLHNARQDRLAEISALEKLQAKLDSREPEDREFAYAAFAALGHGDLALRLIRLQNDEAAVGIVGSIKQVDSNLTEQANATLQELRTNCPDKINDITECPDAGCGSGQFDPELNKRKNIRSDNQQPMPQSFQWLANLPDPTNFTEENTSRAQLAQLGEGQKITVVAYALAARKGSKETCNCGLTASKDTDNHIVLVDPSLRTPTLGAAEKGSETAEFTPRVRLDHKNFTQTNLERLIDPDWRSGNTPTKGKLLVRVTGLLMFDSEHFLRRPLKRHNNWEIHPVLKMEYCPEGQMCRAESNDNWKDLDSE